MWRETATLGVQAATLGAQAATLGAQAATLCAGRRHLDGAVAQAAHDVDGLLVAALDARDAQVRHHLIRVEGVWHGEGCGTVRGVAGRAVSREGAERACRRACRGRVESAPAAPPSGRYYGSTQHGYTYAYCTVAHLLHRHRVATMAVLSTATRTLTVLWRTCCTAIGSRPGVADSASTRKPPS